MKKVSRILSFGVTLGILSSIFCGISGTASADPQAPVTLYADPNYTGTSQTFDVGQYSTSALTVSGGVGNDTVTAVKVAPGYKVTLYSEMQYGGDCIVLTYDNPDLRGSSFNDCVSSLKVEAYPQHKPIIVYKGDNYGNRYQEFDVGLHDTGELTASGGIGNDQATSIKVAPGYKVTIYKNAQYSGGCTVLTFDNANLDGMGFNDCISSLKVEAYPQHMPVILYVGGSYGNKYQEFDVGEHDTPELTAAGGIGNDTATSIKVAPGYRVTLYANETFAGDSLTLTSDNSNLANLGFNDRTTSLRVEEYPNHEPVTLYDNYDFTGVPQELGVGSYSTSTLTASGGVGNDTVSSIRVTPGYRVTLYQDMQYAGSSVVLTGDHNNLNSLSFNDKTSSLRIEQINPVDSSCVQVNDFSDATKLSLLQTFAPRIWEAQGDPYMPSNVEWALANTTRYYDTSLGKYCYRTTEALSPNTEKLAYFAGNFATAKIYAFYTEKDYNNLDLSYFQFNPYNYGKVVVGTEFGDHVGDWEHVTIRLAKFTYNGTNYVKPTMVALPAHSFVNMYPWSDVTKVNTTHVVAYSAKESHGMWKDSGDHMYQDIVVAQLTDECSQGTQWNTWNSLETYAYSAITHTGYGLGASVWPSYFNSDYTNPNSLSVARWGNPQDGEVFGQPILAAGPTGPEQKPALNNYVQLN